MTRRVQQGVHLGDGHALRAFGDQDDRVAGADVAFLEDAEVEARPSAGGQQGRHLRLVHANPDAVAGDARLGDLEQGRADPVAVADADLVVRQSLDGEVLAELPVDEIAAAQPLLPVAIRFDLIDEDRALLSAVAGEIALAVALDVEPPDAATSLHRLLPDAGAHRPSAPLDVARQPDVDREQPGHRDASHLQRAKDRAMSRGSVSPIELLRRSRSHRSTFTRKLEPPTIPARFTTMNSVSSTRIFGSG